MSDIIKLPEYRDWLRDLKEQIKKGQIKAALSVNSQMIMLYWDLGRQIVEKQEEAKWGSGFIEQLSRDLKKEFPEMTGFSRANLFRIKKFYKFYSSILQGSEFVAQPVRQLENNGSEFVAQPVRQLENNGSEFVAQPVRQLENSGFEFVEQDAEQIQASDIKLKQLVQQAALIPWGHNVCIIEKVKDVNQALFYITKAIKNNWSRSVLEY
ncbi:MAG: DUF1016 N-terminal domain-containing protein [Chitinispirillales bacterium]|jgi:predicted nuclease of restriction endonuclease-like (RecB) superfamily|nr:DUF1016 N-terminal domain-containing protein [Chitinispirillales bacterium]